MRKLLSVFLVAILLVGCSAPKETASYRQISMDEAITMMEEESGYIILDVRTPEEFAEYWGWTDLESLARTTTTPEPPCVRDLEKDEIETIIEIIRESLIKGEDDKGNYYAELLHKSMSIPNVMGYIMSDQDTKTIANQMMSSANNVILL